MASESFIVIDGMMVIIYEQAMSGMKLMFVIISFDACCLSEKMSGM